MNQIEVNRHPYTSACIHQHLMIKTHTEGDRQPSMYNVSTFVNHTSYGHDLHFWPYANVVKFSHVHKLSGCKHWLPHGQHKSIMPWAKNCSGDIRNSGSRMQLCKKMKQKTQTLICDGSNLTSEQLLELSSGTISIYFITHESSSILKQQQHYSFIATGNQTHHLHAQ